MTYPVLKHAPIAEAVVDIKADATTETFEPAGLAGFVAWATENYGPGQPIIEQTFEVESGVSKGLTTHEIGRIFWNKEKDRAVQARVDGFTFNILRHYREWPVHRREARTAWDEYRRHAPLSFVRRCALRYLNRIELDTGRDVSELLRLYPMIPDEISMELHEFAMRTVVPLGEDRRANLNVKLPPPAEDGRGYLILDIDVFTTRKVGLDDDLWTELDALNGLAARCFFASLHADVLERFR